MFFQYRIKTILFVIVFLFVSLCVFADETKGESVLGLADSDAHNFSILDSEVSEQEEKNENTNEVLDYAVEKPQPKMNVFRNMWFPYAEIGFYRLGNFIPIGIVPTAALNLSPNFILSVGAGAGYRKQTTQNVTSPDDPNNYYVERDYYAIWLSQVLVGLEWYRTIPHFGIYSEFRGVFHGIDYVKTGSPEALPLFEGVFSIRPYYSVTHGRDLLSSGWSVSATAKFYTSGFYTVDASAFYGTEPFVAVRNKDGKHMFGMVFNSSFSFSNIGSFKEGVPINNFIRSSYKFGVTGGHTIDKPFSMYWTNAIKMTGPMLWEFRFYSRLFFQLGATWGEFYYDKRNNSFEWGLSVGLEIGVAIHDYVGGAIQIRLPVEHLRPSLNDEKWSVTFSFDAYLEQV